jgi:hypothetical protein
MQQRQLPVRPAFVMTNNKVQRQNLCQSGPTCPNLPSHMASCMLLAPMSVLGTVCVFVCRHHHHSHQHQNHCLQVAALFVSLKEIFLLLSLLAVQKLLLRSTTITVVDGGDFLAVASLALSWRYTNIATKQGRPPRSTAAYLLTPLKSSACQWQQMRGQVWMKGERACNATICMARHAIHDGAADGH